MYRRPVSLQSDPLLDLRSWRTCQVGGAVKVGQSWEQVKPE
jgi:hypothetical protein